MYIAKRTLFILFTFITLNLSAQNNNLRNFNINIGILEPDSLNAITDVPGVQVGHQTLIEGDNIRTGVTAVLPHPGNVFQQKVPAAIYVGNGFGKLAGSTQIEELGNLETPIILTNTLSIAAAVDGLIDYTFRFQENNNVRSVNAVAGETNDGYLNDIRGRHVTPEDVLKAIYTAGDGPIEQGNVGAGTGTVAFGYKGGIGTSSRKLPSKFGSYTVGVLVQANFGGVLEIDGIPVGEELGKHYLSDELNENPDGSCMIIVATDAPLNSRNLKRLAKRAILGLAKTGGIASNGSGDYVIAFSTAESLHIPHHSEKPIQTQGFLKNSAMSPLFLAVNEATEEAILNALFNAETMEGRNGHSVEALPVEKVLSIMKRETGGKETGDPKSDDE